MNCYRQRCFLILLSFFLILVLISGCERKNSVIPAGVNWGNPGDEWAYTFGGSEDDKGYSVRQARDGGFIVVGYSRSNTQGDQDIYVVLTSITGTLQMDRYIDISGGGNEVATAVYQTGGSYLITGYAETGVTQTMDVFLTLMNGEGQVAWSHTYGGVMNDAAHCVFEGFYGEIVLGANLDNNITALIAVNYSGSETWRGTFDGGVSHGAAQGHSNSYIIAGESTVPDSGQQALLILADAGGGELWARTYGGAADDWAQSVQPTVDGGYIFTGGTNSWSPDPLGDDYDIYLVKVDAGGALQWESHIGGDGVQEGKSVMQTDDGGYFIAGFTGTSSGDTDGLVVKTDSLGIVEWSRTFGGSEDDEFADALPTSGGGYILAGSTRSQGVNDDLDLWLVHILPQP